MPILLDFVSSECLLPTEEEDEKLYKLSLNIMNNIAHQPETKIAFQQCQASKILKKLTSTENEHLKVLVYLILAQILDEFDPSAEIIELIVTYLKESLKKDHRYRGITSAEYLDSLAKLALLADTKSKLLDCGMLNLLKLLLMNANMSVEEHSNTLTCLWNLCFDELIAENIRKDVELVGLITNVSSCKTYTQRSADPSSLTQLIRKSNSILFTLTELHKKNFGLTTNSKPKTTNNSKCQVALSFHSAYQRDICLKIRDELKSRGYGVQIDLDQQSLVSMMETVEQCSIFVTCLSERYYQSGQCRLEIECAQRLNKHIVCLIVQTDFEPVGWLAKLVDGKIFYKFSSPARVSFESAFASMIKECNRYMLKEEKLNSGGSRSKSGSTSRAPGPCSPSPAVELPCRAVNYGGTNTYSNNTISDSTTNNIRSLGRNSNHDGARGIVIQYEIVKRKCKCLFAAHFSMLKSTQFAYSVYNYYVIDSF